MLRSVRLPRTVGHPHGDGQRQQHVEHQDGHHHRQRGRQPRGKEVAHRFVGGPALAPVEGDDLLDEDPQLHPHGLVQAELLADGVDLLLGGVQAAQHLGRVAAEVLEEEEHQQHHAEQRGDHLPQAPERGIRGASVGPPRRERRALGSWLRALDRYTFQVKLAEADPRFLTTSPTALHRRAGARGGGAYGDKVGEHPVGTGPSCSSREAQLAHRAGAQPQLPRRVLRRAGAGRAQRRSAGPRPAPSRAAGCRCSTA
jgi:hypothetical protein